MRPCTPCRLPALIASSLAVALLATAPVLAVTLTQVKNGIIRCMNKDFKCTNLQVTLVPFNDQALTDQGRFEAIKITMDKAEFEGVLMHDLFLKAYDVTVHLPTLFDRTKLFTTQCKRTDISATLNESELNEAFKTKDMPIQNFKVKFNNGKLEVTGNYRLVWGNNLKMIARLDPKDDGVHLVAEKLWVNGLAIPVGQIKKVLDRMNPLIDIGQLPFKPRVDKIEINADTVSVSG